MTALLQDKVAAYVSDHPGQTAEQIALNIGHRRQAVQEVLNSPLFTVKDGPRHSFVYSLTGRRGTATTHKQRVLSLLQDGQPHSHMEGYRLGVMLHSRVADLRKDGYTIRCWRDGDDYLYQLVGTLEGGALEPQPSAPPSSGPVRVDGALSSRDCEDGAAQLSLIPAQRGAYDEAAA